MSFRPWARFRPRFLIFLRFPVPTPIFFASLVSIQLDQLPERQVWERSDEWHGQGSSLR